MSLKVSLPPPSQDHFANTIGTIHPIPSGLGQIFFVQMLVICRSNNDLNRSILELTFLLPPGIISLVSLEPFTRFFWNLATYFLFVVELFISPALAWTKQVEKFVSSGISELHTTHSDHRWSVSRVQHNRWFICISISEYMYRRWHVFGLTWSRTALSVLER